MKDETAYTQVSDKPDEPSQTPASQPMRNGSYIAMSPVEAQKCWSWFPWQVWSSGRGLREQHMGVILPRVGVYVHSGCIFTYFWGWGGLGGGKDRRRGGTQAKCWSCSFQWALFWLSVPLYSTCCGPHCLPYCNTNYIICLFVGPNNDGTLDRAQPGWAPPSSPVMLLREHGSMGCCAWMRELIGAAATDWHGL